MFWAASQASPMRRVNINGNLTLMDYCTNGPQWASGGFIADSKTDIRHQRFAAAVPGAQQQHRQLVERRLEPGVRRVRSARRPPTSPSPSPTPTGSPASAPTRPCRPTRSAGRSLTSTSIRRATTTSSCRRARDQLRRHHLGNPARRRHGRCRCPASTWPGRPTPWRPSTAN